MLWLYDIPTKAMVALISGAFVVISWAGLLLLGPVLRVAVRRNSGTNALVGTILSSHGIYYRLLLGLLAVATYQMNAGAHPRVISTPAAFTAKIGRASCRERA